MSLLELLSRAIAVDPSRFSFTPEGGLEVRVEGDWRMVNPEDPHRKLFILAAVMEAIEARGWRWEVSNKAGLGTHAALVVETNVNGAPLGAFGQGAGDSPAEALLTAYLAALESISPGKQEAR